MNMLGKARKNARSRVNYPVWWIQALGKSDPRQWKEVLDAGNRPGPMTLRVNARCSSVAYLLDQFNESGLEARALGGAAIVLDTARPVQAVPGFEQGWWRSEEHTSELQSLMRISYAVFCLKQNKKSR